jgi:GMP synthase-like glutamine amidotransferase
VRILALQHNWVENLGYLRELIAADHARVDVVELDEGDPIPSLAGYDAMIVMGGAMDVWEIEKHPWLVAEKAAIYEAVRDWKMPYLGVCLGHQLLADALGGRCRIMDKPEIGVLDVEYASAAAADPLFRGVPHSKVLQWHHVEVVDAPSDAVILAHTPMCGNQAMRVGDHAWGIQYHIEVNDKTLLEWGSIPDYVTGLEEWLGAGALPTIEAAVQRELPTMHVKTERLYDNFKTAVLAATGARRAARVAE